MRAIIVDDEYFAIEGLKLALSEISDVEVLAGFDDVEKFLEELPVLKPDLVFLDIEMPRLNGFEVLELIGSISASPLPNIVFVTAYTTYAVQAYEANVFDYLVKPVSPERLKKTIDRLEKIEVQASVDSISKGLINQTINTNEVIKIHCFGPFTISLGNKDLHLKWRTQKSEELLAYLVAQKGRSVSKERIADQLWPDLDGKKSLSNLYVAQYYLIKTFQDLQLNISVVSERGRIYLDMTNIQCDLNEFDLLLQKINQIDGRQRIELISDLLPYSAKTILDPISNEWALNIRNAYEIVQESLFQEAYEYWTVHSPQKASQFAGLI